MIRCRFERGFTLIEIMVVMVILGILAGLIIPRIMGRPEEARRTKAQIQIESIETALKLYKLDNGSYPTTEQGLQALVEPPSVGKLASAWREGGYLEKGKVPKDPWGNEYVYLFWYDEITQDGPQEIFFRKSTDGGTTWGQKKNLTNNELSSFSPFVTLDRIGNLNLVWCEDDTNDASSIYFSRSINRGDSWTAPVRLTNYASGSYKPAIAVDNECNIFVTWHNKKNNSEVFATASK